MKNIKKKLRSKSGASMLLALVFLLFCMLVGGSVLSAASANGSRAARQKEDQQAYLSQRSASMLLADMLKSTDDAAMQLTIKEIQSAGTKRITIMAHGKADVQKSSMHRLLYELAIKKYVADNGVDISTASGVTPTYVNFDFVGETSYTYAPPADSGKIILALSADNMSDTLTAYYSADANGDFFVSYTEPPSGASPAAEGETQATEEPQQSYVTLSMKCYTAKGQPVTVNGTTTTTTIIRWDDPIIEKGGE